MQLTKKLKIKNFIVIFLFLINSATSNAQITKFTFFGDSDSDNGFFKHVRFTSTANVFDSTGVLTIRPGLMWTESIGQKFGAEVITQPIGGNNYAASSSRINTDVTAGQAGDGAWSLNKQITQYLSTTGGKADPRMLYSLDDGTNDLKPAYIGGLITTGRGQVIGQTVKVGGGANNAAIANNEAGIRLLAGDLISEANRLKNAGAKYILIRHEIITSPDANFQVLTGYGVVDAVSSAGAAIFNQEVRNLIRSNNLNVIYTDDLSLAQHIVTNAARYGITHTLITDNACGGANTYAGNPPGRCIIRPGATTDYLFADSVGHYAPAAQNIVSDVVYNLLIAPIQISMLAEVPMQTRSATIGVINNQIPLSFKKNDQTLNFWTTESVSRNETNYGKTGVPDSYGVPITGTVGFDMKLSPEWIGGASTSFIHTNQTFGSDLGEFTQKETAFSAYTGYKSTDESVWANTIVSYGLISNDIERNVKIGITTQKLTGKNIDSTNTSLAFSGGYNFKNNSGLSSSIIHGPVFGAKIQKIKVDGFTDNNENSVPAPIQLQFHEQNLTSKIVSAGYQVYYPYSSVIEPFAKFSLDHDFGDTTRKITQNQTSNTDIPSYYIESFRDKNYASGSLGVLLKDEQQKVFGQVALNTEIRQSRDINKNISVNFNVNF
jgi:outer membrane lipase/esterase